MTGTGLLPYIRPLNKRDDIPRASMSFFVLGHTETLPSIPTPLQIQMVSSFGPRIQTVPV